MNEKQPTDLLILRFAKEMMEKMEKTKNGFHHHEVKLWLYGTRITSY